MQSFLVGQFDLYEPEPQITYCAAGRPGLAYPDGLLLLPDRTVIFEVKSQHMPEAWWQLRRHYQLVMEQYRVQPVQCIEVVKSFDAAMPFPEKIDFFTVRQLREVLAGDPNIFGVMVCDD